MSALLATLLLFPTVMGEPPAPGMNERGPDIAVLDQIPGCYGAVRFDHKLHERMSSIHGECTNCHHDPERKLEGVEGPVIRPCRECHDLASGVTTTDKPSLRAAYHRQCLSCHRDWVHENACGFCHTASASIRSGRARNIPALLQPRAEAQPSYVYHTAHASMPVVTFHHEDHTQVFGLKCADCHAGSSCGECHGSQTAAKVVNREQSCYKCHSESRCTTCHNVGERSRFDHGSRTGWWLRPGHAALACKTCHSQGEMPERPSPSVCRSCHAQRWADDEFDHARTGVVLRGDHAFYECLDCHRGGDPQMLVRCLDCHTERPIAGERWVGPAPNAHQGDR